MNIYEIHKLALDPVLTDFGTMFPEFFGCF